MLISAPYVLPISAEPFVDGSILVRDGRIQDVGPRAMLRQRYPEEDERQYSSAVLMPGFVDLHTHLGNAVLRGVVHDVPYSTWITLLHEQSDKLDSNDWYDSAILGGLEALSSGITCIADITSTSATCAAVKGLGLRGVIYYEVSARDKRHVDQALESAEEDIEALQAYIDPSRMLIGIAPGTVNNCHPLVYGRVAELATRENLPVAMRLAGTLDEYNFVKYGTSAFAVHKTASESGHSDVPPWLPTGVSPVRYVLNWGAFEAPQVMVVHAVHVDEFDIAKMREYDVSVGICPRCNAQLGMGVAPIDDFLANGLRVGIGTDSPAATDSTDMLSELSLGMLLQRAVNVGEFIDAATMLELATIGGARALGLDDEIGSLEVGKQADIIAVEIASAHQSPSMSIESAVVNTCNGNDVLMTMVAGTILYEKNQWHVDVEVARNIARVIEIRSKLRL